MINAKAKGLNWSKCVIHEKLNFLYVLIYYIRNTNKKQEDFILYRIYQKNEIFHSKSFCIELDFENQNGNRF